MLADAGLQWKHNGYGNDTLVVPAWVFDEGEVNRQLNVSYSQMQQDAKSAMDTLLVKESSNVSENNSKLEKKQGFAYDGECDHPVSGSFGYKSATESINTQELDERSEIPCVKSTQISPRADMTGVGSI